MRATLFIAALSAIAAPALAESGKTTAGETAEKRVCKRSAETGSFARVTKVCMTEREWRQAADNAKQSGREMQSLINSKRE